MRQAKAWMVLAGVALAAVLGVAALVATSGGGAKQSPAVATSADDRPAVAASGGAPATGAATPSAAEIQKLITDLTAQVAATSADKPMTKEEVEAQLRAQLAQLGIKY